MPKEGDRVAIRERVAIRDRTTVEPIDRVCQEILGVPPVSFFTLGNAFPAEQV